MEIHFVGVALESLVHGLTHSLGPRNNNVLRRPVFTIPRPMTTSSFPFQNTPRRRAGKRTRGAPVASRGRRCHSDPTDCPVCLETVCGSDPHTATLPCGHSMHSVCANGLLTLPVLGADSMMRCPLCRCTVDRYDLLIMGMDVSPSRLRLVERRCAAVRSLASGGGMTPASLPDYGGVAQLVRAAAKTESSDGFVYNTVLLALDRALFHRRGIVMNIAAQLIYKAATLRNPGDEIAFIEGAVACHIQVLLETAHVADEDYFE